MRVISKHMTHNICRIAMFIYTKDGLQYHLRATGTGSCDPHDHPAKRLKETPGMPNVNSL